MPTSRDRQEAPAEPDARLSLAHNRVKQARTEAELRQALAFILPFHGLSQKVTANALGRSASWVATARQRFAKQLIDDTQPKSQPHGGRRNQLLREEDEGPFMDEVCEFYIKLRTDSRASYTRQHYEDLQVRFEEHVRRMLGKRLGRQVSRASAYNLMARVGKQRFFNYKAWNWHEHCRKSFYR